MTDMKQRLKAYFAAPLFTPSERELNESISNSLSHMVDVFLPQRDGNLLTELVSSGYSVKGSQEKIFEDDCSAIENADLLVAVLDGRTVDEGVAFELGYARANDKICIGLKTDDRVMLPTGDNPMIVFGCHHICNSVEGLIAYVRTLSNEFAGNRRSANLSKEHDHKLSDFESL